MSISLELSSAQVEFPARSDLIRLFLRNEKPRRNNDRKRSEVPLGLVLSQASRSAVLNRSNRQDVSNQPSGKRYSGNLSGSVLNTFGSSEKCPGFNPAADHYFLRCRILARMRRFLLPIFRRPLPVLFVPISGRLLSNLKNAVPGTCEFEL
jgi:hypothetical protein